jgi:hypothetical protein
MLKQFEFLVTKRLGLASLKIGVPVRVEVDGQAVQGDARAIWSGL